MTEDEIRLAIKNNQPINWYYISSRQKLSEEFIREFVDKVNWFYISESQKLSNKFIKKFKDKVNWNYISREQKLSHNLIKDFFDKIYYRYIPMAYFPNIKAKKCWETFL